MLHQRRDLVPDRGALSERGAEETIVVKYREEPGTVTYETVARQPPGAVYDRIDRTDPFRQRIKLIKVRYYSFFVREL